MTGVAVMAGDGDVDMTRAVVLLSGGMDSATLLHHVRQTLGVADICALSFMYGQKHDRELDMARWQAQAAGVPDHRVVDIGFFGDLTRGASALTDPDIDVPDLRAIADEDLEQPPTYVPHRNLMLLSLAASVAEAAGARDVFYGAQAQDEYGYWDCTPAFVARLNEVLALNRKHAVTVRAPFVDMNKAAVARLGRELGVDFDHTWSCYRGGDAPCGTCPSCVEREAALAGLER